MIIRIINVAGMEMVSPPADGVYTIATKQKSGVGAFGRFLPPPFSWIFTVYEFTDGKCEELRSGSDVSVYFGDESPASVPSAIYVNLSQTDLKELIAVLKQSNIEAEVILYSQLIES